MKRMQNLTSLKLVLSVIALAVLVYLGWGFARSIALGQANLSAVVALPLVALLLGAGAVEFFLRFVLPRFLSDAQRYGIDELGNAQTPEYLEQKNRTGAE